MTARRGAVAPRDNTGSDEKIQIAVRIEIPGRDTGPVLEEIRQRASRALEIPAAVIDVKPVAQRFVAAGELVSSTDDIEIPIAVPVRIEDDRIDILGETVGTEGGLAAPAELAVGGLDQQSSRLPLRAADVHVVEPIAVHVSDCQGRPLRGKEVRHQRLAIVIEEVVLVVPEVDSYARRDIGEKRPRWCRIAVGVFPGRIALRDGKNPVYRKIRQHL